jgi:thiamine pyrophosphokinase
MAVVNTIYYIFSVTQFYVQITPINCFTWNIVQERAVKSLNTLQYVKPEIILCLNGVLPTKSFFANFPTSTLVIAADGAAIQLRKYDIVPHSIVGDLDSISEELAFWKTTETIIYEVQDQNSTDFEKCLEYIQRFNKRRILICGFSGGNLDHTFNNWSIVYRYCERYNLCIYDENSCALSISQHVIFNITEGDLISLIPQAKAILTTTGLKWNLIHEVLELGKREGARNRAEGTQVTIEVHEGAILLFLPSRIPLIPIIQNGE